MAMYESLARVMQPDDTLKLVCDACGHHATLMRKAAFARFGADATPYTIRRRAKCAACGERNRITVTV